jgi:hypothetical protein
VYTQQRQISKANKSIGETFFAAPKNKHYTGVVASTEEPYPCRPEAIKVLITLVHAEQLTPPLSLT